MPGANPPESGIAGAVVIGRNEGARLVACLRSARRDLAHVVYVDSGSSDGSGAAARALGVEVVELDLSRPFTAARARNAGLRALRAIAPDIAHVQFIDGDCELREGWVAAACAFLGDNPKAGVVCGRLRERFPEASIWNAMCDIEWNTPVGEAKACGGIALMRVAALKMVGGFRDDLIAGEEPELCVRLRRAGFAVWRLDREMAWHDAAMTRWGQWARRTLRSGWAYAEGAAIHGAPPERFNRRQIRSIWVWGALVPAAILGGLLLAAALAALGGGSWPLPLAFAGLGLLAYPLMALRIARNRRRRFRDPWRFAWLYGMITMLGKPVQCLGALRFLRARRRGETPQIIEYKAGPADRTPASGGAD